MLILGGELCARYPFLNLHPALPDGPIGTWQQVIWQLIKTRAPQTGTMVHLATEAVDRGPVVSYCTAPIVGNRFRPHWEELGRRDLSRIKAQEGENFQLFQLIRQAEYQREPYLLLETLRAVADGRVLARESQESGQLLDQQGKPLPLKGICLDQEIDHAMLEDGSR
jgi:phosphoribosylglycinamide formyltransferase-1